MVAGIVLMLLQAVSTMFKDYAKSKGVDLQQDNDNARA